MSDAGIKQRVPAGFRVIRGKPQYPSWPAPVRQFICQCGFTLDLKKSGRAEIRHAVAELYSHLRSASHELREMERLGQAAAKFRKRRSRTLKRRARSNKQAS